jgi:hypothetical protein
LERASMTSDRNSLVCAMPIALLNYNSNHNSCEDDE